MGVRFLEDFVVGQRDSHGAVTVDAEMIKAFARQFDPQPFHLDEEAATDSFFGGLVASGWHTASLTMRLLVGSGVVPAGGLVGAAVEELRWLQPVRPGETLSIESEVLEIRPSSTRPQGRIKVRTNTLNGRGEVVQTMVSYMIAPSRASVNPVAAAG